VRAGLLLAVLDMAGIIAIAARLEMRIISGCVNVVLIGYRGSGKTTVGRLVATRLGKKFVDADEVIIAKSGKSIREIFAAGGEAEFRRLEMQAIAELAKSEDHIIAVGGGAVTRSENRKSLAGSKIVYLRCEAGELHQRISGDPATSDNRPSLTHLGGGIEEIEALLRQREPIYRAVMSAEIDVTKLTPEQVVDRLEKLI
jgi:shikimate kinase